MRVSSHLVAFCAGAVLAAAVTAYAVPPRTASRTRARDRYASLDTFAEALSHISSQYVETVPEERLIYGAVHGMVSELDTHSAFLPPSKYRRLREDTEGEYGGVGLTVGAPASAGKHAVVRSVVDQSPADRAGIRPGDLILEVGGLVTAKMKKNVVRRLHARLRGKVRTEVRIVLLRSDGERAREVVLTRAKVKVPTVAWADLGNGIGYLSIRRFQEATAKDLRGALKRLDGKKGGKLTGIILDLRGNPGGLLDQAIRVVDLFVREGTIVKVAGRGGKVTEEQVARAEGTFRQLPMIVLADEESASAAEIVAGALQDLGRAAIVGETTYGKGSVQTFIDLKDGSGLKLTTSYYFTPGGRNLQGTGIKPDFKVAGPTPELGRGRQNSASIRKRLRSDPQLAYATKTLRGKVSTGRP